MERQERKARSQERQPRLRLEVKVLAATLVALVLAVQAKIG